MRRGVVIAIAILGLSACGQRQDQSATSGTAESATKATESAPASATENAPAAATEAAKPDVGAAANQDVTSCLDLVAAGSYDKAVPVCSAALDANPANEEVRTALGTAQQKVAEMAAGAAQDAAGAATGAADRAEKAAGAAEDAAGEAKDSMPAKPY
jgi:uncharacterized protein YjbJ (UPF0337 family)